MKEFDRFPDLHDPNQTGFVCTCFEVHLIPLHVLDSNSDWFIVLFTPVMTGYSNYTGFGFTQLVKVPITPNIF